MYYRLTYIATSDRPRLGDSVLCGNRPLNIGQNASCDVPIPQSSEHEPVMSATIVPAASGEAWHLVRRNDAQGILVNGEEVTIACPLSHGDKITVIDGQQQTKLRFSVYHDGNYDPSVGIIHTRRQGSKTAYVLAIAAAVMAAIAVIVGIIATRNNHDLRHIDLEPYNSSIYHITTDSVYLKVDTIINGEAQCVIIDAIALKDVAEGTCFLTDDGLFVTARHCIEPWLNDEQWDGVSFNKSMSPEVALAARAETANRLSGTTRYHLCSHCIISNGIERYEYFSTDFSMNKTRDQVVCLGTNDAPIYWRSIFPIANRRNMELGDAAYVQSDGLTGDIKLATLDELAQFDHQTDKDIAVIGFPLNDNDVTNVISKSYGNSQHLELDENGKPIGCIQMIASINPGNSGGPVMALIGGEVKAIGIVSKADGRATQGTFWAVPVTEVTNLMSNGGHAPDEDIIFRR
ncbi:MAG: serine protease [Muribaculaceae bacterium]|nr:serine protease [Muribaculaceae bacterium]